MTRIVLPLAIVTAPLVAVAAPGQAERVLRMAILVAVAGVVVDLIRSLAASLPPGGVNPFAVPRPGPSEQIVPAGLVEIERDVRLAGMTHLPDRSPRPERVRAIAEAAARGRLARHGLDLDDPTSTVAAQALLGLPAWEFVTNRRPTVDVATLVESLEAP